MEKKVIIVGAGLVGSLWAVYMAKAGYKVTIYERRSDIRKAEISAGKSINLALRIAFQFQTYDKHHKTTRDPPRLLVVAYNQRVLNMIQKYVDY